MSGTIKGSVIQARDLLSKDSNANPYCIIGAVDAEGEYVSKKEKFKGPIAKKSLFPIWGYEFSMDLQPPAVALKVEVWDDKVNAEFMGYALIKDLKDGKDTKQWYPLEGRYGKKDKVKGDVEVSFKYTANQAPIKLTIHFASGEIGSVLWEKDKSVYAIVSAACAKRGFNIDTLDIIDGATSLPVTNQEITLGELWATDIILENKKKKDKATRKGTLKLEKKKRNALDGSVYGYVLSGKGFSGKESDGLRCIIGPVPSSNEYIIGEKKKDLVHKTKIVDYKNPEWLSFFQFPVRAPVSALKLQVWDNSKEFMGEVILEEMIDSTEVKKWVTLQSRHGKKDKVTGEIEVQYMYISNKSAAEGKTHSYDPDLGSYHKPIVPTGQFSGYIWGARNLVAKDINGLSDPFCLYGLIDDLEEFINPKHEGEEKKKNPHENAKKTKIQKKTLNPEWETYFEFDVMSTPKGFKIEIWDWDEVGTDEFMGKVILKDIPDGTEVDNWFPVVDRDKVSGELHIQYTYLSLESLAAGKSTGYSGPKMKKKKVDKQMEGPQLECEILNGVLAGYVIRAKDLTSKDSNGLSDPYCFFGPIDASRKYCFDEETHNSMKERTPVINKTLHPAWRTYFEFKVKAPVCALKLEVWDWDKVGQDDFMGEVVLTSFPNNVEVKNLFTLMGRPGLKDHVKGQIEVQYTYISTQSLASGVQVPYDPAERKRLEKEKAERDTIDKGDFTYLKVATYEAPNFDGDFFRTKLFTDPKWEDSYCVLFYDIWLIYPITTKGVQPGPTTKPSGHVRLDRFNYKVIQQVEARLVSTGLIPKNERYQNTFALGTGDKECLVECATPEDMQKWIEKLVNHVKNLLRARKFLIDKAPDEIVSQAKELLPMRNPPVSPPVEGKEELWMRDMKGAFQIFAKLKPDVKHLTLFYRFNPPKTRDYLNWFCTPYQEVQQASLERLLQEQEEKWVQSTWKGSFTNFKKIEMKLPKLQHLIMEEKVELQTLCEKNITYVNLYNLYQSIVYEKKKKAFEKVKETWQKALKAVEEAIEKEKADIKAKQEELRQARLAEIQHQRELLENARKEYESQLRDPFSETNMFNDNDDPFIDVVVDDVVDIYGDFV